MPVKKFVLMMAGGNGSRMKNDIPKQFIELCGKPILMHSFQKFYNFDQEINFVLVLPESQIQYWKKLCIKYNFTIPHALAFGGEVRFYSVKNGLDKITEDGIVFIHDGVRPLVSAKTIENCLNTTLEKGNALPVIPVTESVREIENETSKAADRKKFKLVQTPQTFWIEQIKKAYQQNFSEQFTDDASVLEETGKTIYLVDGNRENIKITYSQDLKVAEAFMKNS